jgi:glycosyltransferase involved in cell wall biosynthesis
MAGARALRIALLLHLAPRKLGSLEAWLVALTARLRKRGHAVTVFAQEPIHPRIEAAFRDAGVEWDSLDRLRARPLRGVRRLRRFDVAHLSFLSPHGRTALIGFLAWPTRILVVDHISRVDTERLAGFAGMEPPRGIARRAKRSFMATAARLRLSGLAAVSDYVRRQARDELRLGDDRLTTIYNGIDLERFDSAASRPPGRSECATILTVAHLIPAKGIEYLLKAVAQTARESVRLMIVGDGSDRARLETMAGDLGIGGKTEFCGLRDDVEELLRTSDLFVHPAVWGEAFGLAIAEAMASGCPVIASEVGGIPELVEDGVSGLLVPPADVEALSAAITRLVDDAPLRERLSTNARRRVAEKFNLEACVAAHVAWCEKAGDRKRRQ